MNREKEELRELVKYRLTNKVIHFPIYISLELLQEMLEAHDMWEGRT